MTLCVYALTSPARTTRDSLLRIRGSQGERLRLVGRGAVRAVAGELRRTPAASPESLRRYDRTLRALAASLPAVLPARFGTSFADPAELEYVLSVRQGPLRRALAQVRGRAQMTVRVLDSAATGAGGDTLAGRGARTPSRAETSTGPAVSAEGAGRRYMQERAEAAVRERDVPGFDAVRQAVAGFIRDERVEKHAALTTVYHLVPRSSAGAYRDRIIGAATAAGLQIVVSGPWPPYAFARVWMQ